MIFPWREPREQARPYERRTHHLQLGDGEMIFTAKDMLRCFADEIFRVGDSSNRFIHLCHGLI